MKRKKATILIPVTMEWDPGIEWVDVWDSVQLQTRLIYASSHKMLIKNPAKAEIRKLVKETEGVET